MGLGGGFTGHADHSAITHLASFAFHAAGRTDLYPDWGVAHHPSRLFFATVYVLCRDFRKSASARSTPQSASAITFDQKIRAFECHKTQEPLFSRFREAARTFGTREFFHLAACSGERPALPMADLFQN